MGSAWGQPRAERRVVDAVCADDQLTRKKRALVIQLAGLLDLEDLEVEGLLAAAQARVTTVHEGVELRPGDLVVFTGFPEARTARESGGGGNRIQVERFTLTASAISLRLARTDG